jgi:hypothetical protein
MEYLSARGTDQANKLRREKEAGIFSVDAVIAGVSVLRTVRSSGCGKKACR